MPEILQMYASNPKRLAPTHGAFMGAAPNLFRCEPIRQIPLEVAHGAGHELVRTRLPTVDLDEVSKRNAVPVEEDQKICLGSQDRPVLDARLAEALVILTDDLDRKRECGA
jgi:hypothetical protein